MAQAPAFAEAALGEPGVLRAVLGAALYLTVVGLLGLGLGALLRNTAGGISALFGVLFVVLGALTLERSSRRVFLDDHELPLRRQEGVHIEHQRSVLFTPGATRSVLFTPGATAVGRRPSPHCAGTATAWEAPPRTEREVHEGRDRNRGETAPQGGARHMTGVMPVNVSSLYPADRATCFDSAL